VTASESCVLNASGDNAGSARAVLSLDIFATLHEAIAVRVLRQACAAAGADVRSLRRAHYTAALRLASAGRTGAVLQLPGGLRIRRTYGRLLFYASAGDYSSESQPPDASAPGYVIKSLHTKDVEIVEQIKNISYNSLVQLFDADKFNSGAPEIRFRRAGDYFFPLGSPGKKKLKECFIDARIPSEIRGEVRLLAVGSEIIWVIGHRISELYKVTDSTVNVLRIEYVSR
jgi:tRNA(Ile)-lysidine synthase